MKRDKNLKTLRKIKVIQLVKDLKIGGLKKVIATIAEGLDREKYNLVLLAGIIAIASFQLFLLDFKEIGSDGAIYFLLGKSIASGWGYKSIWLHNSPFHTKFPFLLPLIIAGLIKILGDNLLVVKLFIIILSVGLLPIVYLFFKRYTSKEEALCLSFLTALSPQFIIMVQEISTELLYMLLSLSTLFLIEKYKDKDCIWNKCLFLGLVFAVFSYFTRSIGIVLIFVGLFYLLLESKKRLLGFKKAILFGLICSISVGIWLLRCYSIEGGVKFGYVNDFFIKDTYDLSKGAITGINDLLLRMLYSIYAYAFYAFPNMLTGFRFHSRTLPAFLLSGTMFCGFIYCLLKKRNIGEYYVILYMLILFVWPFSTISGKRFIIPLIPFIFYYFFIAIKQLEKKVVILKRGYFHQSIICLLFLSNIVALSTLFNPDAEYQSYKKEGVEFAKIAFWVKENTPNDAIFYTSLPQVLYFNSARCGISTLFSSDLSQIANAIYEQKVDYIIVNLRHPEMSKLLKIITNKDKFSLVYRTEQYEIYKVKWDNAKN